MDETTWDDGRLTRRTLIGAGAGAAAAGTLGRVETADARTRRRPRRSADVIVIGAGVSGLMAARYVATQGKSVIVLEARDRVGGRTWTKHRHGTWFDVGGQWIKTKPSSYGPAQSRITALARELGVKTFPTYETSSQGAASMGTIPFFDRGTYEQVVELGP